MTATIERALQEYFDGLHHGDTDRLRQVFHPQAIYASASDEAFVRLTMEEYFPIVDARPSPASLSEPRRDRVVFIESVGPVTGVARVECSIGPKRFDDVLTLVRVDDRWQIIAKVFHYELAEGC
jgi:putative lumazine-binding protein